MLHAIIDVGSNTIRLSIFEHEPGKPINQVFNKKLMAGLAGYIDDDGCLSPRGMERAVSCIESHKNKIRNFECDTVNVFATAVLRNAANGQVALEVIEEETGLAIELLSGEDEALLGFNGAMHALDADTGVLFDIGGGSTELTVFEKRKATFTCSMPLGSLNLFLKNVEGVLPSSDEADKIAKTVKKALKAESRLPNGSFDTIYGVGGTVRACGKLADDLFHEGRNIRSVTSREMDAMVDEFCDASKTSLRKVLSVVPDRVHTAVPGMIAARTIMRFYDAGELVVSRYGLREGYLFTRVIGEAHSE